MYELKTESCFDSAHFLSDYDGKCENLHGHRWKVVAYIGVDDLQASGQEKDMVVDFGTFKKALRSLTEELDHTFIVERGSLAPNHDCRARIGDVSPGTSSTGAPRRRTSRSSSTHGSKISDCPSPKLTSTRLPTTARLYRPGK